MTEENPLDALEELLRDFYAAHPDYSPFPGSWTGTAPLSEADWISSQDARRAVWWGRAQGLLTQEAAMRCETMLRQLEHQGTGDPTLPEED